MVKAALDGHKEKPTDLQSFIFHQVYMRRLAIKKVYQPFGRHDIWEAACLSVGKCDAFGDCAGAQKIVYKLMQS